MIEMLANIDLWHNRFFLYDRNQSCGARLVKGKGKHWRIFLSILSSTLTKRVRKNCPLPTKALQQKIQNRNFQLKRLTLWGQPVFPHALINLPLRIQQPHRIKQRLDLMLDLIHIFT